LITTGGHGPLFRKTTMTDWIIAIAFGVALGAAVALNI